MNLLLSRIGLGCVTFGREIDENLSLEILDYAWQNGITIFDTAESYGLGASERILGHWLRSRGVQKDATVITKASFHFDKQGILEALEKSLDRLQLDSADIYLLHKYDAATPLEESLSALSDAVANRLVRRAGCSNFTMAQLSRAIAFAEISVVEALYNLAVREIEVDLFPFCHQRGLTVISYSPLGAGFLTGKYLRGAPVPKGSRFEVIPGHSDIYFSYHTFEIAARIGQLSAATGISPARLALGWVLSKTNIDCVLVGARSTEHVQNALYALDKPLTSKWIEEMNSMSAQEAR